MSGQLSYKTHILIGVRSKGMMTVIADWPQLPKQAEVQGKINEAHDGYVTFALCTPTSILPASSNGNAVPKQYGPGPGCNTSPFRVSDGTVGEIWCQFPARSRSRRASWNSPWSSDRCAAF